MNMLHTPGPWIILPQRDVDLQIAGPAQHVNHVDHEVARVIMLWRGDGGHERTMANARLIAAAPDMLAALKDVANTSVAIGHWMDGVVCAIAKAEGTND